MQNEQVIQKKALLYDMLCEAVDKTIKEHGDGKVRLSTLQLILKVGDFLAIQ